MSGSLESDADATNLNVDGMHCATSGMSNQLAWLAAKTTGWPCTDATCSRPVTTAGAQPPTFMFQYDHSLPVASKNLR